MEKDAEGFLYPSSAGKVLFNCSPLRDWSQVSEDAGPSTQPPPENPEAPEDTEPKSM